MMITVVISKLGHFRAQVSDKAFEHIDLKYIKYMISVKEQYVRFLLILDDRSPSVKCALVVLPDLSLSVFLNGVKLQSLPSGSALAGQVCHTSSLSSLLEELEKRVCDIRGVTQDSSGTKVLQFVTPLLLDIIEDSDSRNAQICLNFWLSR
ncbi:hypothetical protein HPB48_019229 [Haemaphysalis longicornis]|uniref:Uncharacterized protein n=1 Tax=Haemaphysalis longicornis TaxID=44386 RepID=A0A9J6G0S9_HAELO|nr:hypothetical protein HPB48_019229 [Haemaphysalis longicornis]